MKLCTIVGDLSSDSTADQYPIVNVCDDCTEYYKDLEESPIVIIHGDFDASFSDECALCDKSRAEELEEQEI